MESQSQHLLHLMQVRMPFGKHKGRFIVDLPETYLVWFESQGFPEGQIGQYLREVYEIKLNGLEYLFHGIRRAL